MILDDRQQIKSWNLKCNFRFFDRFPTLLNKWRLIKIRFSSVENSDRRVGFSRGYIQDFEGYTWVKFLSLVLRLKNRCDFFNKAGEVCGLWWKG